jgi:primosomal protein N' (replication factor Y)
MELMYIVNVIPLIKIPRPNAQILSYFSGSKIIPGAMVKISIRNRKINAIVLESKTLEQERLRLKKYIDFEIKPLEKIVSKTPVLNEGQLKLLIWLSDYYFAPIGLFARIFLAKKPSSFAKATENKPYLTLTPKTKGLVFGSFGRGLKSITIEDESSELYKSWGRKPYYNAKNIAIQLAKIHNAKLVLKSNLPSIEGYYHAQNKKFKLVVPNIKYKIPNTSLVDMRQEMRNGNFSVISNTLRDQIENHDKTILFISRRGTSTIVLCRECGYIAQCPSCEMPMVYHEDKPSRRLVCHHCGKDDIAPVTCPNCKSIKIKYLGAGTQKIESEIKKIFLASPTGGPNKKVLRLDGDISEKPEQQQKIIKEFNDSDNAVMIGSQMLLNKNLKADLVAIVSIDTILNLPDFKSSERVFQTINQLIGMANKNFLIQTYNSENKIIKLAIENNFNKFYNEEIKDRKLFNYPPFSEIIKLSFGHKDFIRAKNEAIILKNKLEQQIKSQLKIENWKLKISLLGPTPAFISREKGLYKWNIIIKSQLTTEERNKILIIVPSTWEIEINPDNTL